MVNIYIASKVKYRHNIYVEKIVKHTLQKFIHVIFIRLDVLVTIYNKKCTDLPFS